MLRYDSQTKHSLVALYDIRPGNGVGLFLQPWSPHGAALPSNFHFGLSSIYVSVFLKTYCRSNKIMSMMN